MQEYNKGFAAGVCSLAGFIIVYMTTWQLITERVRAKRIEDIQKITANFAMVQQLLADGPPQLAEEDHADESGSDQASSSASNLSRADVKQGDDR